MHTRPEPTDPPPDEGFISLGEYGAQHGATYHQVYGWVRWGHLVGERYSGRWWVRRDAPPPQVRRGGWGQEQRLRVIHARRSPESWRGTWDRAAAAAKVDPARRREIARQGGTSPKRRRNHGPCAVCGQRTATAKGRCARCNAYLAASRAVGRVLRGTHRCGRLRAPA